MFCDKKKNFFQELISKIASTGVFIFKSKNKRFKLKYFGMHLPKCLEMKIKNFNLDRNWNDSVRLVQFLQLFMNTDQTSSAIKVFNGNCTSWKTENVLNNNLCALDTKNEENVKNTTLDIFNNLKNIQIRQNLNGICKLSFSDKHLNNDDTNILFVQITLDRFVCFNRQYVMVTLLDKTEQFYAEMAVTKMTDIKMNILYDSLPYHVVEFLLDNGKEMISKDFHKLARKHENVTICFLDIVGFTTISKNQEPFYTMSMLNSFFSKLDILIDKHGVQKVEISGDCYIVCCGLYYDDSPIHVSESAKKVVEFAKEAIVVASTTLIPLSNDAIKVRVGIHTGSVVSGVIGSRILKLSLIGDAMNKTSRLESLSKPNKIHVSETTKTFLPNEEWEENGKICVKGIGQMKTYFLKNLENLQTPSNQYLHILQSKQKLMNSCNLQHIKLCLYDDVYLEKSKSVSCKLL